MELPAPVESPLLTAADQFILGVRERERDRDGKEREEEVEEGWCE